jgi:hypothetical protein
MVFVTTPCVPEQISYQEDLSDAHCQHSCSEGCQYWNKSGRVPKEIAWQVPRMTKKHGSVHLQSLAQH